MSMNRILLLNGPNLDMLGVREPEVYGCGTLRSLEDQVFSYAQEKGAVLSCFQSNSEGDLVNAIHGAAGAYDGIVYNPGAHTHYSYALRDAIASIDVPVVEVHISNVDEREPFRAVSVIAPVCVAQVKGLGFEGYCRAVDILCEGEDLARLGEGYEKRYPAGTAVIVADGCLADAMTAEADPTAAQPTAPDNAQPEALARLETLAGAPFGEVASFDEGPAADCTAPYAAEIAAENPGATSQMRQDLVRATCAQSGLAALLVRDTSNIRWITAFDGVFDEERAHALLVCDGLTALHTDSRYSNALRTVAARTASSVVVDDRRVSHANFAKEALCSDGDEFAGVLGIEDSITYAEFVKMAEAFGTPKLGATTDFVLGMRAVKDRFELVRLRAAQAVTDAAFAHIIGFMRPGMTEREVQLELDGFMVRHGAEGLAFPSIVATGANGADPHAIPGATRLEAGQCVVMDFGAKAFGYCSDMTRTVFLGRPDGDMARAWETLRRANETVEAMLAPGVTGREAHETAERVLAEGGFAGKMGHGLGHGVGIDVHEQPVLNPRNERPLVVGNVVTVEPGIYIPGAFGMRLEDCGVITPDGYEAFSNVGHDMVVL